MIIHCIIFSQTTTKLSYFSMLLYHVEIQKNVILKLILKVMKQYGEVMNYNFESSKKDNLI